MALQPTDVHRARLREEAAKVRLPDDPVELLHAYREMQHKLRPIGKPSLDAMIPQLEMLALLLERRDELRDDEIRIAAGALHYFLTDEDMVSDAFGGEVGLVDDAIIVCTACHDLEDTFKRLGL